MSLVYFLKGFMNYFIHKVEKTIDMIEKVENIIGL